MDPCCDVNLKKQKNDWLITYLFALTSKLLTYVDVMDKYYYSERVKEVEQEILRRMNKN